MTFEVANALSAAISAIAVVISLIFVGFQLRASARSQRALAAWQSENSWAQLNFELAKDPHSLELIDKIYAPQLGLEALEGTKRLQAQYLIRSFLQHAQSQYFLFREGSLSREDWTHQRNWLVMFIQRPLVAALLTEEIDQAVLSRSLLAELEIVPARKT